MPTGVYHAGKERKGEAGRGFVRCSYAAAYEKLEEALERMHRFMRQHG